MPSREQFFKRPDRFPVFVRAESKSPTLSEIIARMLAEEVFWERLKGAQAGVVWHCHDEKTAVALMLAGGEPIPDDLTDTWVML